MGPMDQLLGPKSRVGVPGPTWACSCLLIVHLTPQDTGILAGTLLIFHFLTLSLSPHLSATVGFRIITKRAVSPPPSNFSRQISQSGNLQLSIFSSRWFLIFYVWFPRKWRKQKATFPASLSLSGSN